MKVETDITASMVMSQMGRAVIIIMYVETFRTVVIVTGKCHNGFECH